MLFEIRVSSTKIHEFCPGSLQTAVKAEFGEVESFLVRCTSLAIRGHLLIFFSNEFVAYLLVPLGRND